MFCLFSMATLSCSDDRREQSSATSTSMISALETSGVEEFPHVGQRVEVWVYPDAPTEVPSCLDLVTQMIPSSAPRSVPGKAAACTFRTGELGRLLLVRTPDSVYHLKAVEVLLLYKGLPERYRYSTCQEVIPYILSGQAPSSAADGRLVCFYVPPYTTQSAGRKLTVWGLVPLDTDLAADSDCKGMVVSLSRHGPEVDTRPYVCSLTLP